MTFIALIDELTAEHVGTIRRSNIPAVQRAFQFFERGGHRRRGVGDASETGISTGLLPLNERQRRKGKSSSSSQLP